ncbi:MAG: DUF554 domain-containing protein [Fimbriimonas sp.]
MRGTLLNTATVLGGSLVGLALGKSLPDAYREAVMSGIGLVTLGIGVKMFLQTRNILVVAAAVAIGAVLGTALGLQAGLEAFAEFAKAKFGGSNPGPFSEAIVTTSLLFCVGPMTILGCIQDAVEGKSELLSLKSTLDGFGAIFFAAAMGPGVVVTAFVVLVFQSLLTLLARPLQPLAKNEDAMAEISAAGGPIMLAIGLSLLSIKTLPTANYIPALFLAPAFVLVGQRVAANRRLSELG